MDNAFTLFAIAMVVFAILSLCFRGQHNLIATIMALIVVLVIGALMLVHAQDKQMGPLPDITHSRPTN